jgi:molecular chaperone DnaK
VFAIDSNGIVQVTARDLATGKEQSIQVNPAGGLSKEEIDRMIQEADKNRADDLRRREVRTLRNRLEGLLYTNERVFKEFGKTLDAGTQEEVKEVLARGRRLIESEDTAVLQEAINSVQLAARALTAIMMDPKNLVAVLGGSGSPGAGDPGGTGGAPPKQ